MHPTPGFTQVHFFPTQFLLQQSVPRLQSRPTGEHAHTEPVQEELQQSLNAEQLAPVGPQWQALLVQTPQQSEFPEQ